MLITIEPNPNDPSSVRVWWRDMIGSRQYGGFVRESLPMSEASVAKCFDMLRVKAAETRAEVDLIKEPK